MIVEVKQLVAKPVIVQISLSSHYPSKLYEHMLKERLEKELKNKNMITHRQSDFHQGRSMVQEIARALEIASRSKEKWCVLIIVDVNSATWSIILK